MKLPPANGVSRWATQNNLDDCSDWPDSTPKNGIVGHKKPVIGLFPLDLTASAQPTAAEKAPTSGAATCRLTTAIVCRSARTTGRTGAVDRNPSVSASRLPGFGSRSLRTSRTRRRIGVSLRCIALRVRWAGLGLLRHRQFRNVDVRRAISLLCRHVFHVPAGGHPNDDCD